MKKILFLGIGFYDYELEIVKRLKNEFKVDYFSFSNSKLDDILNKIKLKNPFQNVLNKKKIHNIIKNEYDIIFVIKCENISLKYLQTLKKHYFKSKFILYLWDSKKRIFEIEKKLKYFDIIHSFDRIDCIEDSRMIFTPLFFRNEILKISNTEKIKYDVYHLGWNHSDRIHLLDILEKNFKSQNVSYNFKLYTGVIQFLKYFFKNNISSKKKISIFKSTYKNHIKILSKSKIVLDITHPDQNGLTIRTIETLGSKKKLITTNREIKKYDFYNKNNIYIIDRENPNIDLNFINSNYEEISESIINNYSIDNWIKKIFNDN